jgi:hypothetical protein
MYDNIYLQNRIGFNGKIKKSDFTIFDNGLKLGLWASLILCVIAYLFIFFMATDFVFTIDLFFETLIAKKILKVLLIIIVIVGLMLYYCFGKSKHSVAFQVNLDADLLTIVFNEGKHIGMEYHLLMNDISNICVYKNGSFSFYCNNMEVEKNGKVKNMKGTVKFIGGDSGDFVADLQDYLGRKVKYVNKKD